MVIKDRGGYLIIIIIVFSLLYLKGRGPLAGVLSKPLRGGLGVPTSSLTLTLSLVLLSLLPVNHLSPLSLSPLPSLSPPLPFPLPSFLFYLVRLFSWSM